MAKEPTRCTRCILPENYPDIGFDSAGVCRVCREFEKNTVITNRDRQEKKLQRILNRYRGNGKKYDVLVPFSGGKDSTYTLLMMKEKYQMRCLALTVDNGFLDRDALAFAKRTAGKLGVDHVVCSPDRDLLNRVYGRALRAVGEFCAACVVLIPTMIFRTADTNGIRLIAVGFSDILESPPPETSYMDRVCFRNIMMSEFSMKELKWNYFFPSWKRMFRVKQINLPDYLHWEPAAITESLKEKLDFKRSISEVRSDCAATQCSSYLFKLRTGFGKYEYLYANMVRAGAVTREEALRIVKQREPDSPPEGFEKLLSEIGCGVSDLEGIEKKSVFHFRTRNRILRRIAIRIRKLLP